MDIAFLGAVSKELSQLGLNITISDLRKKTFEFIENFSMKEKQNLKGFMTTTFRAYISHIKKQGS